MLLFRRKKIVKLSKCIDTFGNHSFYGCKNLQSIIGIDSISKLEEFCFCESGVENIKFGGSLEEMNSNSFYRCLNLKEVNLNECSKLRFIGSEHFMESSIESIILPNTIKNISPRCFYNCKFLVTINFPEDLEEVQEESFYDCANISKINLTNTKIIKISNGAFCWCSSVTSFVLPPSLQYVGSESFEMVHFNDITLSNLKEINESSFEFIYCNKIDISESPLSIIPACAFGYGYYKSIKLPKNLKIIGEKAFTNCEDLESIEFPSTLEEISEKFLRYCSKLKFVDLSKSNVKEIPRYAFEECIELTQVLLPSHSMPLRIQERAFQKSGIKKIKFPPDTEYIGAYCFEYCQSLESADLSECNFKRLEEGVFFDCSALENLNLGTNIVEICSYCFFDTIIKSFKSSMLSVINESAFSCALKLEIIDISESKVKIIPKGLCYSCRALKIAKLPRIATLIDAEAFMYCNNITLVEFPSELVAIKREAFAECFSISVIDLSRTKLVFIERERASGTVIR